MMMNNLNLTTVILLFTFFSGLAQITPQFDAIPANYSVNTSDPVYTLGIGYDSTDMTKQVFHLFLPDTTENYPLVIFIHGGGFIANTPNTVLTVGERRADIKYYLENGIAFASVGYRLINNAGPDTDGVIKCLEDTKRAIQFIRFFAEDLHIDPTKIALEGRSAGASASYWLSVRPDMADPMSSNPISKESTRVCGTYLYGPQATLDFYRWETEVFQNYDGNGSTYPLDSMELQLGLERASNFYGGFDSVQQILTDPALIQYRQEVDQLSYLSSDDPPMYISSQSQAVHPRQDLFHHSLHGNLIYNTAMSVGIAEVRADIPALSINTTDGEEGRAFLVRCLSNCSLETASTNGNQSIKQEVSVYPNPVDVHFSLDLAPGEYHVEVVDATGKVRKVVENAVAHQSMDVSALPSGVYFVRVKGGSDEVFAIHKIIKL